MKRMLINATQAEERRLAIVDGQKLLDYEIEIEGREQRKGNIYKAVITRVEPSLEACFIDYGEDRHGFLPFKEISKLYFQQGAAAGNVRIQDAIREGQELLVQVEKEERGNKGAALTTFVSLAGRYVVLMPNNPRGGGVSRRIEGDERAELKEALDRLEYPAGMSIIARTAGIGRSSSELQWDLNYLLKLWTAIDGAAKGGKGAYLIYQESSLVIRAIRDYFNNDIGDILIDTDDVFEQANQFMAHVMPEHAARVKRYRDDAPLFSRFQIEHQIESAYARTVQLPSGGAIVIDHTEALVSVDVNSARAIRGGDIEETATRTNLEAAEEVARQMRLRDLGGLIVIDFIDMEESRNRRDVENRLRDALRQDRARVQFGTISKFGLMEMSRQRLRPALSEGTSIPCPRCGGSGHIRDTESSALQILRVIQEESLKDNTASVLCQVPVDVASFLLNEKRTEIAKIELRQRINVLMVPNKTLETPNYRLERLKHDDPRLDNIEASYKMADEVEDPTAVTRRSQEPTNKQTPLIKGVLPDAQTSSALPQKPLFTQAARTPPHASGQEASKTKSSRRIGLIGWLKQLFADKPVTSRTASKTPFAKSDTRRDGRSHGRENTRHTGRNATQQLSDGSTENRADTRGEGRDEGRGPRAESYSENYRGGRGGRGGRTSRGERGEGSSHREKFESENRTATPSSNTELLAENDSTHTPNTSRNASNGGRNARNERGSNRNARAAGERQASHKPHEGGEEVPSEVTPRTRPGPTDSAPNKEPQRAENSGRSEGRGTRNGRGERGARTLSQDETVRNATSSAENQEQLNFPDLENSQALARAASQEKHSSENPERNERQRTAQRSGTPLPTRQSNKLAAEHTVEHAAPIAAKLNGASELNSSSAQAGYSMPKITSYILPMDNLQEVARNSGLQWVNSDATRVAAVQAAIAAEPRPQHIPRARQEPVVVSQAPLILVETKRDLQGMQLPFEKNPPQ